MAKLCVCELAKKFGITSKELVGHLKRVGEFVKPSSSSLEPLVVWQMREKFAAAPKTKKTDAEPAAKASKSSVAKPAAKKPGAPKAEAADAVPKAAAPKGDASKPGASKPRMKKADVATKPGTHKSVEGGAPRPASCHADGPRPAHPDGPYPGGPRPGNNPYASSQGMPRPGGSDGPRPGAPRPGGSGNGGPRLGATCQGASGNGGPRPGAPRLSGSRPNPGMMSGQANFARNAVSGNGGGERTGRGGRGRGDAYPGGVGVGVGDGAPQNNGGGFGGPRGSGRGGCGPMSGAFGRGDGRSQRGRKSKRARRQEHKQQNAPAVGGVSTPRGGSAQIRIRQGASLADLAEKIDVSPAALVMVLSALDEMATTTQSLDQDIFEALGTEFGHDVKVVSPEDKDRELLESFNIDPEAEELDDAESMVSRPPVVTVMGHIDHSKTKLLDATRHTDIVDTEHGGIIQHIGVYQVTVKAEDGTVRPITLINTPGHEAFMAMCARGAQVTDIAALVVAADDGVMPQTVEAINHAQAAGVPIIIAANKVDKDTANPEKIHSQLIEYGLVAEEYGGDVMFVDISAKQRKDIRELLETVLLTADAVLTPGANPNTDTRGVAAEVNLDEGHGAVATMLVQRGTLHVGDSLVVGSSYGRVRTMFDDSGNDVSEVGPPTPVAALGLTSAPRVGNSFLVAPDDRTARQIVDKREVAKCQALLAKRRKRVSLEDFDKVLAEGEADTFNLVIKGDVSGAVEALEDSLLRIDMSDEVALRITHRGVGAITQNDVNLATVDNAVIIGFSVRPAERVAEMADVESVGVKYYNAIYSATNDIETALKGMSKPIYEEVQLGTAEARQAFRSGKLGNIADSIVRSGTIKRSTKARLARDGVAVADNLGIVSLRRGKDDVTEAREGCECGITLGHKDIAEGDIIEIWEMREKVRD